MAWSCHKQKIDNSYKIHKDANAHATYDIRLIRTHIASSIHHAVQPTSPCTLHPSSNAGDSGEGGGGGSGAFCRSILSKIVSSGSSGGGGGGGCSGL